jgi:acyl-CoA-binding protein
MSLDQQFQEAQDKLKTLSAQPNDVMLKLYALFKQSTKGDVEGKRPGMLDIVARAKYDAWAQYKGKSTDEAKQEYINFVDELVAKG